MPTELTDILHPLVSQGLLGILLSGALGFIFILLRRYDTLQEKRMDDKNQQIIDTQKIKSRIEHIVAEQALQRKETMLLIQLLKKKINNEK